MEVQQKIRKNRNPITSECQIIPSATTLKRGRLVLGVLLCIRGNKIHYYSFITQGKQAVFEEWLFKMPVQLGQRKVKDFKELKTLLRTNVVFDSKDSKVDDKICKTRRNLENFEEIRKTFSNIEATVISNAINSSTIKIIKSIANLKEVVEFGFESQNKKAQTIQDSLEHLDNYSQILEMRIQKLKDEIELINITHEYHVTNSLNFNGCNFQTQEDVFEKYHYAPTNASEQQSTAGEKEARNHRAKMEEDMPEDTPPGDDEVRVFRFGEAIQSRHWDKFYRYYSKIDILDVIYAEINWLKDHNYAAEVERIAPLVMGKSPPITSQPKQTSLYAVFEILRTSRISR